MPGGWGWDDDSPDPEIAAANGRQQARVVQRLIRRSARTGVPVMPSASLICGLHRIAMEGLLETAGRYRREGELVIGPHVPPPFDEVPALMEEMCTQLATNWDDESPIDLGAYALWRTCWIHPFEDGNGRTARAVAYLVICTRFGFPLPGRRPIPARITDDRKRYYAALAAADGAWKNGALELKEMKSVLRRALRAQLTDAP